MFLFLKSHLDRAAQIRVAAVECVRGVVCFVAIPKVAAILAAAASLSFVFIRKPLVLEEVSDQPMVLHAHQLSHVQEYMTQADESSYLDKSTQSGIRLTRSTADEKKLGKSVSYDKGRDLIES